jgi:hypothetical protein
MNNNKKIKIGIYGPIYHTNLLVNQINNISGKFYAKDVNNNRFSFDCDIYHGMYSFLSKRYIFTKLFRKKNICHWIGTDVFEILNDENLKKKFNLINKFIDINVAVTENLIFELKTLGIDSKLMPIVSNLDDINVVPFSKNFSVFTYIPENRLEFYNYDVILELIKNNPDIRFFVIANSGRGLPQYNNVEYVKWSDDVIKYYHQSTVILRIPKHDGLSLTVLEALSCGRQVIWNFPFPYCHYSPPDFNSIQNILDELKKNPLLNVEGSRYVKEKFSLSKIVKNDLFNLYDEVLCA